MELKVYRRPDRQWKCGLHASVGSCPLGPDERGRCSSQHCHPKRTLRWWRSYLPVALAVATFGISIAVVVTERHREIIAPGPLSLAHAQLIHNPNDPHRCANCHEDAAPEASPYGVHEKVLASTQHEAFASLLSKNRISAHSQTERCLVCHAESLPQLRRAMPHDLELESLEQLTASAKSAKLSETKSWLASFIQASPVDWHQHRLTCSDCHREHQGAVHDLQAIASQRCQACHQTPFNSFAFGHPEFTNYPAHSTNRLAFDHSRHSELHFSKSNTAFDCRVCHVNGAEQGRVGRVFRSVAFETACASCHLAPMKTSLADGVIVFQLPSLDLNALAQRGMKIGTWPEEAGQSMDGVVPPLMRLLFADDADAIAFFRRLPPNGKLSDFDIEKQEDREALLGLAVASRRLLEQLASRGQPAMQERLASRFDAAKQPLIERIIQGVPPDLFRQAYRDWFVGPAQEAEPRNGLRVSVERKSQAGQKTDSQDDLLLDQPTSLTSDSLLSSSPSNALLDNSLLDEDLLSQPESVQSSNRSTLQAETKPSAWEEIKSRQHLFAGGWMIDTQRMAILYVPSGHADPWLTAMISLSSTDGNASGTALAAGSAVRSSDGNSGYSKPRASAISSHSEIFNWAVGRCTECHQALESTTAVNKHLIASRTNLNDVLDHRWRAEQFDARVRQLTRFDHGPHLIIPSLADCVACHRMQSHASTDKASTNTIGMQTDFHPMKAQDCAACHQPQAAGDNCIQCHNYHTHTVD
ncbi:MAG: hypothetical protein SGI77_07505 [Pirellulaceae bacterium]|nr:hypothetical protein [Pirellulaceae bacterium]